MNQSNAPRPGKSNSWQIYATGVAVCAAVSAGAYLAGIEPALARRAEAAANTAELQTRRENAAQLAGTLAATRRKLAETNRELAGLTLRLESAATLNSRLARLSDLAIEAGLTLDEVQPGTPADGAHYQTVPIRIVGAGTYPACAAFLRRLRERFPDTSVRSFELASSNPLRHGGRDPIPAVFRVELTWHTALPRK